MSDEDKGAAEAGQRRQVFVVINPAAAGGAVGETWSEIALMLSRVLGPYGWEMTQGPGEASGVTRRALEDGFDVIASLGGDGTHNEVINGFFGEDGAPVRPGATLALLPFGTGGDFRKTLGLTGDLEEAARWIAAGVTRPCDVGRLTFIDDDGAERSRHFINIASFGLGGLVDRKVNASSKALGGKVAFAWGTLQAFAEFTPPRVKLRVDETIDLEAKIDAVAVANGRFFGGGMKIAPNARIDDGMFDIVVMRNASLPEAMQVTYKLYEGRHFEHPSVTLLQARKLYAEPLEADAQVLLDVDGEAPGRLPATFEVLPGAVSIVVKPK